MPLVRRRRISLPLKDMAQMSSTLGTYDFRPRHAECTVRVSRNRTWDGVEVRGPPAAALEFVVRGVERGVAGGAGVNTFGRCVLVIFAGKRGLGAFLADDTELFY